MAEAAAAHAAATAQAIKASGTIVQVEGAEFQRLIGLADMSVVIRSRTGLIAKKWCYLTSYKGLAFYAESVDPLPLPGRAELIDAKKIWIPG